MRFAVEILKLGNLAEYWKQKYKTEILKLEKLAEYRKLEKPKPKY